MPTVTINDKEYAVQWIDRDDVLAILQEVTSAPEYIFSVKFRTRNDRKNLDDTIRPAGTIRHLTSKRKQNNLPTKDWTSKRGRLNYNPVQHDLFQCYTIEGRGGDDGRGNHWAMVCCRSAFVIKNEGVIYFVRGCDDSLAEFNDIMGRQAA